MTSLMRAMATPWPAGRHALASYFSLLVETLSMNMKRDEYYVTTLACPARSTNFGRGECTAMPASLEQPDAYSRKMLAASFTFGKEEMSAVARRRAAGDAFQRFLPPISLNV